MYLVSAIKKTHILLMYLIVFGKGLSYREGKSLEQNTKKKFNIGLMKCQTNQKWNHTEGKWVILISYKSNRMSLSVSVCLSELKDLANCWIGRVLIFNVDSPEKVYNYFGY